MNTTGLYEGLRVKNYKALCELLGEKVKTGKSKQLHLKEMERYFKFHKEGNAFVVDEVYAQSLEKKDGRSNGNNATFKDDTLQSLLKLILAQSASSHMIAIPKHVLYSELSLVNKYYSYYRKHQKELVEEYPTLDLEHTNYFFSGLERTLENVVKRELDRLNRDSFITWEETRVKVVKRQGDGKLVHYLCTDEEVANILTVERQLCDELGYENTYTVAMLPLAERKAFYNQVQYILNTEYKMYFTYSYSAYKIVFTKSKIQDDLNRRGLAYGSVKGLSESAKVTMIQAVKKRVNKRQDKAEQKSIGYQTYVDEFDGLGIAKSQENTEYCFNATDEMMMEDSFMDNMELLIGRCMLDIVIKDLDKKLKPNPNIVITSKARGNEELTEEQDVLMSQVDDLVQQGETEQAYHLLMSNEKLRQQFEQFIDLQSI